MRSRGSGSKKPDGTWQTVVTLTLPDGTKRRRWIVRATQREMMEERDRFLREEGRNAARPCALSDVYERFVRERGPRLSESYLSGYRTAWNRIGPRFGKKRPDDIKPHHVYAALEDWSLELKGSTLGTTLAHFSQLYVFALQTGLAKSNPCRGIGLPARRKAEGHAAVPPAHYRLLRLIERRPECRLRWRLMGECGLRASEAARAVHADLRTEKGVVWLRVRGTKTEAARRDVPVPRSLAREWGEMEAVAPVRPTSYQTMKARWTEATEGTPLEGAVMHGLRKCAVTTWIGKGLPDDAVKAFAGHSTIQITKDVYNRVTTARLAREIGSRMGPEYGLG